MNTLDALYKQHQTAIGLEDFSDIKSYVKRLNDVRLFDKMRERIKNIFTDDKIATHASHKIDSAVIKWLNAVGYPNLKEFTVYVPVNLVSTVDVYLTELENISKVVTNIVPDLLEPSINLFGILLNNPDVLKSNSPVANEMTNAKLLSVDMDKLIQPLSKCFNAYLPSDQLTFQRAYARIGDLESANTRVGEMQDAIGRSGFENVRQKADELFVTATNLAKEFKSNSEYNQVSKKITAQISECLYINAKWVELYGAHVQQLTVMATAINDTVEKINKAR